MIHLKEIFTKFTLALFTIFLVAAFAYLVTGNVEPILQKHITGDARTISNIHVVDGDTIKGVINGRDETIRIIGIDTPEKAGPFTEYECYSNEATEALQDFLNGKKVSIQNDPTQDLRDRYDRILGHVFADDELTSSYLTRNGFAREYTYQKPSLFQNEIRNGERHAKKTGLGLWGEC